MYSHERISILSYAYRVEDGITNTCIINTCAILTNYQMTLKCIQNIKKSKQTNKFKCSTFTIYYLSWSWFMPIYFYTSCHLLKGIMSQWT